MRRGPRVEPISFAALNIGAGKVVGQLHRRHRCNEFLSFRRIIEEAGLIKPDVHLVMDNYGTHKTPSVKTGWLAAGAAVRRGTHRSTVKLQQAIRSYLQVYKRDPRSIRSSTASNDSACELLTQDTRPLALVMLCTAPTCRLLRRNTTGMTPGRNRGPVSRRPVGLVGSSSAFPLYSYSLNSRKRTLANPLGLLG